MELEQLRTMVAVGAVTMRSARIWARSDRPGPHQVILDGGRVVDVEVPAGPRDGTAAWTIDGLVPDTEYHYEVRRGRSVLGRGRFRTAPDGPASFCFGLFSCHQPCAEDGAIRPGARRMLGALHAALTGCDARFVLPMGDQMYSDEPEHAGVFAVPGLLTKSHAEIRAEYHRRYREAWSLPELQRLYAEFPSWPMLDDHELSNNWGSLEKHATPRWATLREAALAAYEDYQASRIVTDGPPFDHGFRWGGVAVYTLDLRSQRRRAGDAMQIVTPAQLAALAAFLHEHRDARVVTLVLSVPIAYVPSWISSVAARLTEDEEGADRWSFRAALPDRDRLLRLLVAHAEQHPHQHLVLASGDVHVATALQLRWDGGPTLVQLTSSALTNELPWVASKALELAPESERVIELGADGGPRRIARVERLHGDPDGMPYGKINMGLVHVEDDGRIARISLELLGEVDGAPVTVFRTPWLEPPGR